MSLYIDIKYLHSVSYRLENFKKKSQDLYNCRCPLCGDSQRNKRKARGYFYRGKNDLYYKCHKCGASHHFGTFLKNFDANLYSQYVVERYADGAHNKTSHKTVESVLKFEEPKFAKKPEPKLLDSIMDRLDTLPDDHEVIQYVTDRKIPRSAFDRLYFIPNVKDVVQLNAKYKDSIITISLLILLLILFIISIYSTLFININICTTSSNICTNLFNVFTKSPS